MASRSMTEAAFLVLIALLDEPRYGYAIVREVADLSDGDVTLSVGTLYGVLDRLTADGLVELDREEIHNGRLRRYYRLTDPGVDAVEDEAARLAGNVQAATDRLGARTTRRDTGSTRARPSTGRPRPAGGPA